jgi:hypothetical protein
MPRAHRIANPKPIPGFQYRYIRDFLSQAFAPLGFIRFRAVSQGLAPAGHFFRMVALSHTRIG